MLMSIHMNDNGITLDQDFMLEILDMFGISETDLPPDRLWGDHGNDSPVGKRPLNIKNQDHELNFDFRAHIQKYMNLQMDK